MIDLLLTNARVVTADPRRPRAAAVAVIGDRIAEVYDEAPDINAARTYDLDGAVLTPGFHDAHCHTAWFGLNLLEVDLSTPPVHSLDELYAAIEARATETARDGWVIGSGYDQNKLGGHPDREVLDQIAGGRRVWLKHTSGHMCMVNSPVLADLGLSDTARDVPGGSVVTDASGRPTGLMQEQAQTLVAGLVMPYSLASLEDAIERAGRQYLREGITSATEAGIAGGWIGKSPVEFAAYQNAYAHGRLPVRMELMVAHDALHRLDSHADDRMTLGLDLGLRTGFGDDWLRIGPLKVFSDGSLIGRTSAMCEDFADSPGNRGYLQDDADALRARIVEAHVSGWRVATHAIGDAAIDLALDAYAQAQAQLPIPDVRHRIEHFGVARPDQVTRAAELGVIAVPQGRFVNEIGDGMIAALGPVRSTYAYRQRSILDAGMVLPGSSDRPVVHGAPLLGMHDMVHRRTSGGADLNPAERISGAEALAAFTTGSAYASKAEDSKGSISPGLLADFAVLSGDPTTLDDLAGIDVLATIVGGRLAHDGIGLS